jgi:signal transduction histidine kinase
MSPRTTEWTLRRRLIYTFIVGGAFVAVVALLTTVALIRSADRTHELLDQFSPARTASFQLESALLDQETGVRGFELSGQLDFLEPYTQGTSNAKKYLATAADGVQGKSKLERDLSEVRRLTDSWRTQYAEQSIAATKAHRAVTVAETDLGKRLFDSVRASLSKFQNDLNAVRTTLNQDLINANRTLRFISLVALLAILVAGVVLWRALSRWVLTPLARIGAETRQVVNGALTHRITVDGPQEITTLAGDVDAMRGSLVAALAGAVTAQDRLKDQTARLEAQTDDLRRSNSELEQFAYVASHDLQEPLRKVASFCQMLSRRYSGELDERGQQYIDFAVDGAKRMQRLINDLLSFSRVGRTTGEFEDISLDNVLDRALTSLGSTIEESDAVIDADALPIVHGNSILLTQVFQNLIGNAIKFHGMATPRVRISVERKGDQYEFACSDNGIGIEPQYAERVFIIFQRLHGKDQYDGTGIGLAMCRKIVEHHGGRIWLETGSADGSSGAPGGGTTFRWTLPVPSSEEPVPGADQPAGQGEDSSADQVDGAAKTDNAPSLEEDRETDRVAASGVSVARTESDA